MSHNVTRRDWSRLGQRTVHCRVGRRAFRRQSGAQGSSASGFAEGLSCHQAIAPQPRSLRPGPLGVATACAASAATTPSTSPVPCSRRECACTRYSKVHGRSHKPDRARPRPYRRSRRNQSMCRRGSRKRPYRLRPLCPNFTALGVAVNGHLLAHRQLLSVFAFGGTKSLMTLEPHFHKRNRNVQIAKPPFSLPA